ncbi:MAG: hypothetical protein QM820_59715 [Minicystis sp.]
MSVEQSNGNGDSLVGVNTAATAGGGGAGIFGVSNQFGNGSAGIWGQNNAAQGTAVVGAGQAQPGTILTAGSGGAFTGSTTGLFALATTAASGTGVLGAGNNVTGFTLTAGSGGAFTGFTYGLYARNTSAGSPTAALYTVNFSTAFTVQVNYWDGVTSYKIIGSGSVSTLVRDPTDPTGQRRLTLHAPETPEIYFEDYGEARLENGYAHVELDPRLTPHLAVNEQHPLRVFIQFEEDEGTFGVVVKNKTSHGFDVVEIGGGTSNMPFQWHIVANRADEEFPDGRVSRNADTRLEVFRGDREQAPVQTNAPARARVSANPEPAPTGGLTPPSAPAQGGASPTFLNMLLPLLRR